MKEIGIAPQKKFIRNEIRRAVLYSPNGTRAEIDASSHGVVVIDRAYFDKALAQEATRLGAEIDVASRVTQIKEYKNSVKVEGYSLA